MPSPGAVHDRGRQPDAGELHELLHRATRPSWSRPTASPPTTTRWPRSRRCSRARRVVGLAASRSWSAAARFHCCTQQQPLARSAHERSPSPRCRPRSPTTSRHERRAGHRARARGARQGRADHPAERAVRGPLLLPHAARGRLRARASGRRITRRSRHFQELADAARRRDPGVVLRAGRARALQLDRGDRRRRHEPRRLSQERTSPTAPAIRRSSSSSPATPGFAAFATRFGTIGVAICWDQWFPEAARAMTLAGADVLFYPTAIGSEPEEPELDSRDCVAARDDRPRGRERGRRGRGEPDRHRGRGTRSRSTAARSCATPAATSSPSSAARRARHRARHARPRPDPPRPREHGLLPRPPARTLRKPGRVANRFATASGAAVVSAACIRRHVLAALADRHRGGR